MRDVAFKYSSVMTGITTQQERKVTCTAKTTGNIGTPKYPKEVMKYVKMPMLQPFPFSTPPPYPKMRKQGRRMWLEMFASNVCRKIS